MYRFELIEYKNSRYVYAFMPYLNPIAIGKIAIYDNGDREVIEQLSINVKQYYAGYALWGIPIGEKSGIIAGC